MSAAGVAHGTAHALGAVRHVVWLSDADPAKFFEADAAASWCMPQAFGMQACDGCNAGDAA